MENLQLIKHLEENIGENLCDLGVGNSFLYTTPEAKKKTTTTKTLISWP